MTRKCDCCGREMMEDWEFCPYCGNELEDEE